VADADEEAARLYVFEAVTAPELENWYPVWVPGLKVRTPGGLSSPGTLGGGGGGGVDVAAARTRRLEVGIQYPAHTPFAMSTWCAPLMVASPDADALDAAARVYVFVAVTWPAALY
jgi:hypothetical protein